MYRTGGASVRACLEEDDMINSEFNAKSECNLKNGPNRRKTSSTLDTGRFMPFIYARANPQYCLRN